MKKKYLLIVIDGLSDRKIKELGFKTPLELAKTPNLDYLASYGKIGLLKPVFLGKIPSSKDAHLSLFGYDLRKYSLSRGVVEALGVGFPLKKGDLALRGNFATVDENLIILDRRAKRIENPEPLRRSLDGIKISKTKFFLRSGVSHRLAVILRGKKLSDKISDSDPGKIGLKPKKIKPLRKTISAIKTAKILNEFEEISSRILKNHPYNKKRIKRNLLPANFILLRGAGFYRKIPSFYSCFFKKAVCIAGGALYKGIGKALKMDVLEIKGATGKKDTNLRAKIKGAIKSLKKYDFCFLHIKATDNFSHDGDFLGKKKFIEKIDRELRPLLFLKKTIVIITADHSTPSKLKQHSADPIPYLIWEKNRWPKKERHFSERDCQKEKKKLIFQNIFLKKVFKMNYS